MKIPFVRKIGKINGVLLERALPVKGNLITKKGDKIEPFTKLGMTKVSLGSMNIDESLRLSRGKVDGGYFYKDEKVGTTKFGNVFAPFDGILEKQDSGFILKQEERDFWLLSGAWGEVIDVLEHNAVLMRTSMMDIHLPACTQNSFAGELVVFPNPSELLEMQYLEKFAKDILGKILYIGDFVSFEMVKRAAERGVSAIIAGSADRASFTFAKQHNLFLGVFSGFGRISTPKFVFGILKEISNRYIFLQGERHLLRVPMPAEFSKDEESVPLYDFIKDAKAGDAVQVFEKQYFGFFGKIDSVQDNILYVKLDDTGEVVNVHYPNLLGIA